MSIVTNANNNLTYTVGGKEYVLKFKNYGMTQTVQGLPEDTLFLYLADNYNTSTKILTNCAPNGTWGDLSGQGTMVKNGSGSSCYLSTSSHSNYLSKTLTSDELTQAKANTDGAVFTLIFKVGAPVNSSYWPQVFSTRTSNNHQWMLRSTTSYYITYYNTSGTSVDANTGIVPSDGQICKLVVKPTSMYFEVLTSGENYTVETSTSRNMNTSLRINTTYNSDNGYIDKFYGMFGIARELTSIEENYVMKAIDKQISG